MNKFIPVLSLILILGLCGCSTNDNNSNNVNSTAESSVTENIIEKESIDESSAEESSVEESTVDEGSVDEGSADESTVDESSEEQIMLDEEELHQVFRDVFDNMDFSDSSEFGLSFSGDSIVNYVIDRYEDYRDGLKASDDKCIYQGEGLIIYSCTLEYKGKSEDSLIVMRKEKGKYKIVLTDETKEKAKQALEEYNKAE